MASETPDARDRAVAEAVVKAWHELPGSPGVLFTGKELRDAITAALATARAEEREACVAVVEQADEMVPEGHGLTTRERALCNDIAAALRARGEG